MNNIDRTIKLLDFPKILDLLSACAQSEDAKKQILSIRPESDSAIIKKSQQLTEEAKITRSKYLMSPILAIDNIDEIIVKCRIGITLQMGELLKIARVIKSAAYLKEKIMSAGDDIVLLKNSVANIYADKLLEKNITDAIISDNEMSDNASFRLKSIRRNIGNLNARLKEKLNSYTKSNDSSEYLQDNLYTIRNNRFVLPVKSECRSKIPGLIHDQSATGATVFIEPFAIVDLNNELRTALSEESAEIENILIDFTHRVYNQLDNIKNCKDTVIMSDIVYAKAVFSEKIDGIMPNFSNDGNTQICEARHPLINRDKVVPTTVAIGKDYKLLLITGPNTGGKTVCMKTIGLFCLMAYCGIHLPCKSATIGFYDEIFCDIGDEQSISSALSTFSSHIVNINNIVNSISAASLVLLDELGGGTDPTEGSALAIGVIKYLEKVNCCGIISTHYDQLKEYALSSNAIKNACMLFDEKTLLPTYRLVTGMPGSSNALKIAEGLGLNGYILTEAQKNLDKNKIEYEKIIKNAEKIKNEALEEKIRSEQLNSELLLLKKNLEADRQKTEAAYEKIKSNAAMEVKRIVASKVAAAENIIADMKMLLEKADEEALLTARNKRNKLLDIEYKLDADEHRQYTPVPDSMIKVGAKVILTNIDAEATILELPNKKGEIRVKTGNITTNVRRENLGILITDDKKQNKLPKKRSEQVQQSQTPQPSGIATEIMVIGKNVDEAVMIIEPYILSAHDCPDKTLRIIHGKGTMALAKGIQKYLKTMPLVKEYRFGKYGEGESGVTIVTVK